MVEKERSVGLRVTGNEIGRVASGARRGEDLMTKTVQKITLSPSRDIPFDKLMLSQSNVRRIKAGVSVEELAEDIARRGLLQSLSVRPVLADDGTETGKFEIPAGGRRFQACEPARSRSSRVSRGRGGAGRNHRRTNLLASRRPSGRRPRAGLRRCRSHGCNSGGTRGGPPVPHIARARVQRSSSSGFRVQWAGGSRLRV